MRDQEEAEKRWVWSDAARNRVCKRCKTQWSSTGQWSGTAGRRRRSSVKFGRQIGPERSCWRYSLKRCGEAFCPWTPAAETSRHIDTMRWSSVAAMLITTSGSTLQCATESAQRVRGTRGVTSSMPTACRPGWSRIADNSINRT